MIWSCFGMHAAGQPGLYPSRIGMLDTFSRTPLSWLQASNPSQSESSPTPLPLELSQLQHSIIMGCFWHATLILTPAQFLPSLGASCRAQRMTDLEYYVHWSRHLPASISFSKYWKHVLFDVNLSQRRRVVKLCGPITSSI